MTQKNPFIAIIKKTLPATVTVVISKHYKEVQKEALKNLPMFLWPKIKDFRIPKEEIDEHGMVKIGNGSGFIVEPSGVIVSNRHVVGESSNRYTVVTTDNNKFEAKVIARDPISDIAILKIEDGRKFPTLKLGDSSKVELGETVLAAGNALGLFQNTVSSGIISGLSRSIAAQVDAKSPAQEIHGLIQTDAAINPGNSGGPLVNMEGEVIGINVAIIFGAQNIGFALPINTVKRDLEDIKKYGRIRRPFLGVQYVNITPEIKKRFKLSVDRGALIMTEKPYASAVIPKSPAHEAGLKEKDIILEYNGHPLTAEKNIGEILEDSSVGDVINLKVLRREKEFFAKAKLQERK